MKKILKTIACCLGALAIAFTAFFVPTTKKSANAVYTSPPNGLTWTSSNIIVTNNPCYSQNSDIFNTLNYDYAKNTLNFKLTVSNVSLSGFDINLYSNFWYGFNSSYQDNKFLGTLDFHSNTLGEMILVSNPDGNGSFTKFLFGIIPSAEGATLNMKSLEVGYGKSFLSNVPSDYFGFPSLVDSTYNNFTIYSFTDTANWKYIFLFNSSIILNDYNALLYNIYYDSSSVDLTDNQIYQEGYDEGYNIGLALGSTDGYNNGYSIGYDVGFGNGRNEGIQNANNYSFLGLFGAIVDAPLTGLRSLFNFEFLGINLLSFITSLLTIALITFVIKKLMGR